MIKINEIELDNLIGLSENLNADKFLNRDPIPENITLLKASEKIRNNNRLSFTHKVIRMILF